ncbi:hypothetical protein F383_35645 [Gossypium arboreum]|uniref:Uncharacterized protein n=1 Tax=Gossypium arboreum TaxID=29729 RepID=A0A0B0N792_GOSAR|nr:hypothetical protein F383_35645 [Gossypium arboreum]
MASASRYESYCKTMSGTWHRPREIRASLRSCLGHCIGLEI